MFHRDSCNWCSDDSGCSRAFFWLGWFHNARRCNQFFIYFQLKEVINTENSISIFVECCHVFSLCPLLWSYCRYVTWNESWFLNSWVSYNSRLDNSIFNFFLSFIGWLCLRFFFILSFFSFIVKLLFKLLLFLNLLLLQSMEIFELVIHTDVSMSLRMN